MHKICQGFHGFGNAVGQRGYHASRAAGHADGFSANKGDCVFLGVDRKQMTLWQTFSCGCKLVLRSAGAVLICWSLDGNVEQETSVVFALSQT
jgi:hypothetical protein